MPAAALPAVRYGSDLVVFLEYLSEAGEVECLIVLQQNETEVELAERQLDVVHRLVHGFVDAALHRQLSSSHAVARHIHRLGDRPAEVRLQRGKLARRLRKLFCNNETNKNHGKLHVTARWRNW